jgi:hypothetical protein
MLRLALLTAAAATAASSAYGQTAERSTSKAVEPFAQCFAAAQDRAAQPWSFVPKESGGGTFSNLGANGVRQPYFLDVADRGARRELRLTSAGAAPSVIRAVDSCI